MCGVFGLLTNTACSYSQLAPIVKRLVYESSSRGKDATGLAIITNTGILIAKSPSKGTNFLRSSEYTELVRCVADKSVVAVLGHARLATHGSVSLTNTHPLVFESLLGVHNGIITNYQELSKKETVAQQEKLDSQALFTQIDRLHTNHNLEYSVAKVLAKVQGTATVATWSRKEKKLVISTNFGSLFATSVILPTNKTDHSPVVHIFASEQTIVKKSLKDTDKQSITVLTVKPNNLAVLHPHKKIKQLSVKNIRDIGSSEISIPFQKVTMVENSSHASWPPPQRKNDLELLRTHQIDEKKIATIPRCTRCILPNTTPFIQFNKQGVCNYCEQYKPITYQGISALVETLKHYHSPKCLVAFSGGRDSSYGLHFLKKELGLDPIAFTYDWGMVSDLGRRNQARIVSKLQVEHVIVAADITKKRANIRKNILAWLQKPDLGMVPLFMSGDKVCEWHADRLMKDMNIPLMFFCRGNTLEREEFKAGHSGVVDADPEGVIHQLAWNGKLRLAQYYAKQFLQNPAYINDSIFDTLAGYAVTYLQPHSYLYLWHYLPWDEHHIVNTLTSQYDWELPTDTTATWRVDDGSPAFYNYIYYQLQGFTENDSFRSNQIREGKLTREQALSLVAAENKPRYEALAWYFNVLDLDGHQVLSAIDRIPTVY